jgi:ribosomal protein S18 acetylase RimI-like enzyme
MTDRRGSSDLLVRRLVPDDAGRLQALRLRGLQELPEAFASSYEDERDKPIADVAATLVVNADRAVFGAFDVDELVGVVGLRRETLRKLAHKAIVNGLYVAASHRGRGIGRKLFKAIFSHAHTLGGIRQLTLIASAGNDNAIRLYESVGFRVYGTEPDALQVDGVFSDDVHMVCLLGQAS